ncbi:hypothetical protein JVU11DRAFT_1923 [Chiua virens]|nr:hypothetical protein JVU11DRAFT_1923 [Chiua virens]
MSMIQFDAYPSPPPFSDASSTPRTPSPHQSDFLHINPKQQHIPIGSVPHIFQESDLMIHNTDPAWFTYPNQPNSLLHELYDAEHQDNYPPPDLYLDDVPHNYPEWHSHHQHHLHHHAVPRRATYPYVRHDLPQHQYYDQYPVYQDALPDRADAQPIKLEDTPLIVPSQMGFPIHPHHPSFLPSASGAAIPVQLTDDCSQQGDPVSPQALLQLATPPNLPPGGAPPSIPVKSSATSAVSTSAPTFVPVPSALTSSVPVARLAKPPPRHHKTKRRPQNHLVLSSTSPASLGSLVVTPFRVASAIGTTASPFPPSLPRRAPPRHIPPLILLPPSPLSQSHAAPKARQSSRVCSHLFASRTHPSQTSPRCNSLIPLRAKRRQHLIIIRSQQRTRVSQTLSAGGHCLCSAMPCLLRHQCRHNRLRSLSRQSCHCSHLHSLTLPLSYSPLPPLSRTFRPHKLTSFVARTCYLLSFDFAFRPTPR